MWWPTEDYWIVGRELLIYRFLDLAHIPKPQRAKVLSRQLTQLSPFSNFGHFVSPTESGEYMIWFWDEELRLQALETLSQQYSAMAEHIHSLRVVPETILLPFAENGLNTLQCCEGEDVQFWKNGVLESSRWGVGNGKENGKEVVSYGPNWSGVDRRRVVELEDTAWRLGFFVLLLLAAFDAGRLVSVVIENRALSEGALIARTELERVIEERNRVREVKNFNERLLSITSLPNQLSMLAEVDEVIPMGGSIWSWEYGDNNLRVGVSDKDRNDRLYVEQLSSSDMFSDVDLEPGDKPEELVIKLRVE